MMSKTTLNENLDIDADDLVANDLFGLEARLLSSEDSASLPSLSFASSALYSRDGNDLLLTLEGQIVVVENYFSTPTPPTLTTMDGAIFSPELVASFLQHEDAQDFYAHSWFKNFPNIPHTSLNTKTIAIIQELEGSVLVIRNGEAISLKKGGQVLPGDEISTSIDSSASMIFADGTLFKIGSKARIALDEFAFESSTSTGLQILSIVSGAFSYISGLVAKNDPANVQLRTPFGEVGIRGTKIVGVVDTEKAEASITLLEGRILYKNPQGEEYEINQGFDTLKIKNGGESVKETTLSAERVARSYDIFENADEVSDFLQKAPATQQQQGTDEPLPNISYSQAQEEIKSLAIADPDISLGDTSSTADLIGKILEESAKNSEERMLASQSSREKELEDESLNDGNFDDAVGGFDQDRQDRYAGGAFDIPLNTLGGTNKVLLDLLDHFAVAENAPSSAIFNFQHPLSPITYVDLDFFIGGLQLQPDKEFSSFIYDDIYVGLKSLEWKNLDGVIDAEDDYRGDAAPPQDDLMIRVHYTDDSSRLDTLYYFFIGDYFKNTDDLPAYSVSFNGGSPTPLELQEGMPDLISSG